MSRSLAILAVLFAALCMSFAALFVRLIESADGFQILIYRSSAQGVLVLSAAIYLYRGAKVQFLRQIDRLDWCIAAFMMIAFSTYVLSLLNTSVASTLFILSIAPAFAALLGWAINGERPNAIASLAIVLAIIGVFIMIQGGLGHGKSLGNALAVLSALCFALMLVLARKSGKSNVLLGNGMGALLTGILMLPVALIYSDGGIVIPLRDIGFAAGSGMFTIGLGILFISLAAPHLPPHELSLLVLLESILSPIWVWLLLGEPIGMPELIGGALVLSAIVMLSVFGKKENTP